MGTHSLPHGIACANLHADDLAGAVASSHAEPEPCPEHGRADRFVRADACANFAAVARADGRANTFSYSGAHA